VPDPDSVSDRGDVSQQQVTPKRGQHPANAERAAPLPLPVDDVLSYSARIRFTDGTTLVAADNLADPYYSLYRGPTDIRTICGFASKPRRSGGF
jgi:hypothetical protein